MCKRHYKEYLLGQSNNNEVSQSNNDAQQGAMVLAAFSGHINNREINSNVSNEEATRNDFPAVSHQQNINLIVKCVADNNTTVSHVELQPAINSNVCNKEATCNDVPTVSHQQNINSIVECVADNNTTVSRVELQPAAENVVVVIDESVQHVKMSNYNVQRKVK
jgi:hypothetical protein